MSFFTNLYQFCYEKKNNDTSGKETFKKLNNSSRSSFFCENDFCNLTVNILEKYPLLLNFTEDALRVHRK